MRTFILFVLSIAAFNVIFAQEYTWSEDVAPIIYENCASCHHDGGIAPFNLMSYDDAAPIGFSIADVVDHGSMPPWPANPDYMHFVDEAILTDEEKEAIIWWALNGMPIGDEELEPDPPIFLPSGSLLESIDMVVEIEPYTLQSNNDETRWFVIPNPSIEDFYIAKIEVMAGQESVVHHADLFYDNTNQSYANDQADPLPGFNNSTGWPNNSYYINAWQPGGNVAEYPDDWGILVPAGADLVVEIHYGPGGQGLVDSTYMNIQFLEETPDTRPIYASWLLNYSSPTLVDGPLVIPANEVVTFNQVRAPLTQDISLVSICPHMHYLGSSYTVWYQDPDGQEHPLIEIPHWDFHWQKYYTFETVQHIPAGSILKGRATYDNTVFNHDNPFDPPQTAYGGSTTLDEMMLCYFVYTDYQPGDENIVLGNQDATGIVEFDDTLDRFTVFPNPARDFIQVELKSEWNTNGSYRIWGSDGSIAQQGILRFGGLISIEQINIEHLPSGLYHMQIDSKSTKIISDFIKL